MLLDIIQIIVAVLLITTILLQNQGAGLGAAFGGSGSIYHTKRGVEKTLFIATISLAVIFLVISFINAVS